MKNRKDPRRDMIRMAARLRERLLELRKPKAPVLPDTNWQECQRLVRRSETAIKRGWFAAAERIRPRLDQALGEFQAALNSASVWPKEPKVSAGPSLRELHEEFRGLMHEFPEAEFDLGDKTISVVTESIVLEEVSLGPFRIELDLGSERQQLKYTVIATDPNPAATNEEVTHPHVQNDHLCEGEGGLPIHRALEEGRLDDFFQIAAQVLHTYNPGSAYVALNEWEGVSCVACGASVGEDERTRCSADGDTVCYECVFTCPDCDHDFAPELAERCQACEEGYCPQCLDEGICHACQKEAEQEENHAEQHQTETRPGGCRGHAAGMEQIERLGMGIG